MKAKQIMLHAADLIDQHGKATGAWVQHNEAAHDSYCASGALILTVFPDWDGVPRPFPRHYPEFEKARTALYLATKRDRDGNPTSGITGWSDGNTKEVVVAKMREVASTL